MPELEHGQWQVVANAPCNDVEGGDPCRHAVNLRAVMEHGRLVGCWTLPLAIRVRWHESIRAICALCVSDAAVQVAKAFERGQR